MGKKRPRRFVDFDAWVFKFYDGKLIHRKSMSSTKKEVIEHMESNPYFESANWWKKRGKIIRIKFIEVDP